MRRQSSKVRLAQVASRQWGRVTWATDRGPRCRRLDGHRLAEAGLSPPRPSPASTPSATPPASPEADLAAALLYAGPGAMLSHATAAWWLGLLDDRPRVIHVSTPRQCRSQPGIKVHPRRQTERVWHRKLPVTTLPQTLLDLAAQAPLRTVRARPGQGRLRPQASTSQPSRPRSAPERPAQPRSAAP